MFLMIFIGFWWIFDTPLNQNLYFCQILWFCFFLLRDLSPRPGGYRLAAGVRSLESGAWQLEAWGWKLEGWRLEAWTLSTRNWAWTNLSSVGSSCIHIVHRGSSSSPVAKVIFFKFSLFCQYQFSLILCYVILKFEWLRSSPVASVKFRNVHGTDNIYVP